jgi:hypothetical protein
LHDILQWYIVLIWVTRFFFIFPSDISPDFFYRSFYCIEYLQFYSIFVCVGRSFLLRHSENEKIIWKLIKTTLILLLLLVFLLPLEDLENRFKMLQINWLSSCRWNRSSGVCFSTVIKIRVATATKKFN